MFREGSSLMKMNMMLDNFEKLCCSDPNSTTCRPFSKGYTNFSVAEILRSKYGASYDSAYDSDGTRLSEYSDAYSSCDEYERTSSPESQDSEADAPLDFTKEHLDRQLNHKKQQERLKVPRFPLSNLRHLEEDGYSSSDSEVAITALDLRVSRKKTPPKHNPNQIPAWVFCTRYSDRPAAAPRARRRKTGHRQHRTRTAFNDYQLAQLNIEFEMDKYLSETRRHRLAEELNLKESNVKVWFQNKRAKCKKVETPGLLAIKLQEEGLYNHKPNM